MAARALPLAREVVSGSLVAAGLLWASGRARGSVPEVQERPRVVREVRGGRARQIGRWGSCVVAPVACFGPRGARIVLLLRSRVLAGALRGGYGRPGVTTGS